MAPRESPVALKRSQPRDERARDRRRPRPASACSLPPPQPRTRETGASSFAASSARSAPLARPSSGALRTRASSTLVPVGKPRHAVDRVAPALRRQTARHDDPFESRSPGFVAHAVGLLVVHRMQIAHHRLGALVEHVGIDLGRRNVGVAEQILDDAQIRAVLQEVAREGVAQHVRADAGGRKARRGQRPTSRSRAKACRVIWPLALSAGKSQGEAASAGRRFAREARDRRRSRRGRDRRAARGAPCRLCRGQR